MAAICFFPLFLSDVPLVAILTLDLPLSFENCDKKTGVSEIRMQRKKLHEHQNTDLDLCDYVSCVSACRNKILSS